MFRQGLTLDQSNSRLECSRRLAAWAASEPRSRFGSEALPPVSFGHLRPPIPGGLKPSAPPRPAVRFSEAKGTRMRTRRQLGEQDGVGAKGVRRANSVDFDAGNSLRLRICVCVCVCVCTVRRRRAAQSRRS